MKRRLVLVISESTLMLGSLAVVKSAFWTIGAIALLTGCLEQYDPKPHWDKWEKERLMAQRPVPTLTAEGKIPAPEPVAGGPLSPADAKFKALCASCHGLKGDGDSPMAATLNPRPRNFTDAAWQAKVDDAHIAKVIKEGGAAVGLSPLMAPWGAVLSDELIQEMVKKIRAFKK